MSNYISEFIDYLTNEKRFSVHTSVAYKKDIEQFFESLGTQEIDIKQISHRDVRHFIIEMSDADLENSSINRKLSSLKTFFKYLKRQEYIEVNPMLKVKSLKTKKRLPQFVPENQLWEASIFHESDDVYQNCQDELILEMFYQTGIRLDELIHLSENNINSQHIKVLGKRNKERLIPISKPLFHLIENYRQKKENLGLNSEYLFITKKSKNLSPKFVYDKVNYYLGKATNLKKKSPHVLRHTFATHMLNNGASIEAIKSLLGHTDLTATQVYTHNTFKQVQTIYKSSHPRGGD